MTEIKKWRVILPKDKAGIKKRGMIPRKPLIPSTLILDGVYFIGDEFVGCHVVDTGEGLVLLDCMFNSEWHYQMLLNGFEDLELDIKDVKYIIISHGHSDHYGYCDRIREISGAKIVMSKVDNDFAMSGERNPFPPMSVSADIFVQDGDKLEIGNTTFRFYETGGHTPYSVSVIFDVYDMGRKRTAAINGGCSVTPSMTKEEVEHFLKSARRYRQICKDEHADTLLSPHQFEINGKEKIDLIRKVGNEGVFNPFVVGTEGVLEYNDFLIKRGEAGLKRFEQTNED